jgi:mercuric ion transport protein
MVQIWRSTRGFVAGVVAFVTCPCHLPITLPLLIAFTSGTVFGTWLADERNIMIMGGISTIIFIGGLALAFKWINEVGPSLPDHQAGRLQITSLTPLDCASCEEAKAGRPQADEGVDYEKVGVNSSRRGDVAATHDIFTTPVTVMDDLRNL